MADPPFVAGAVKAIEMVPFPGLTLEIRGTPGTNPFTVRLIVAEVAAL